MKVTQGLGTRNLEAYGDPQLIKWRKKFKSFYAKNLLRQQNAKADALALLINSLVRLPGASEKIWVFTKDLYCHNPPPEDVTPLSTVKLWKHQQPRHLDDISRCTRSDPECVQYMRTLART